MMPPSTCSKNPADGAADTKAAALAHIGIEPFELGGPVDLLLDHRTGGGQLLGCAGALGVRTVAGHEQASGGHGPDGVDHLEQGVWAAPGN